MTVVLAGTYNKVRLSSVCVTHQLDPRTAGTSL